MRDPAFHRGQPVEHRETHVSHVFLVGDRVFKLKKPVRLPFADLSTLERRRFLCHEEVRLNRRLAPDVYVGVRAIAARDDVLAFADADEPSALEYAVEMRRLDERNSLASLIDRGEATVEDVRVVAQRIAEFHARTRMVPGKRAVAELTRSTRETFETLLDRAPASMLRSVVAGDRFATALLTARSTQLHARALAGRYLEGHGDLRAEHVFIERGVVRVIDCAELAPRLREVDAGADLSFLVMDLEMRGRPDLAAELIHAYRGAGGDPGPGSLICFHAAQRAWIRAKVDVIRGQEAAPGSPVASVATGGAQRLARCARRLAWGARRPILIVVCGPAASGKTTLATKMGEVSALPVLSSDRVRKGLAGLRPTDRGGDDLYTREFNQATYAELGRLAAHELRLGRGGIIDATFRHRADRDSFTRETVGMHPQPIFVECHAPAAVTARWAAARAADRERVSDATATIAEHQRFEFEPLDEVSPRRHLAVRTDRPVDEALGTIEVLLDELLEPDAR